MHTLAATMLAPVLRGAARRALVGRNRCRLKTEQGRFTRRDVDLVLVTTWRLFDELSPALRQEVTMGARINLMLACVTLSFHRALIAHGTERPYATELVGDAAWVVYRRWGAVPRLISRFQTADPVGRLRIATNLFRRFPFNPPSYVMRDTEARDAVVFDVLRCPIAEYFRDQGEADVCVGTWCNLDYPLAETWGGHLVREQTLAAGATRCTFRWEPGAAAAGETSRRSTPDAAKTYGER
jgi:ubiquinone biosynthesis protein